MSYRALITVFEGNYANRFTVNIGEDFIGAESAIHLALRQHIFDPMSALNTLSEGLRREGCCEQQWDAENAAKWVAVYADQYWTVHFEKGVGSLKVTINGYDSGNVHIFMRSQVYGLV